MWYKAEEAFKVGDVINVMPPNMYCNGGVEAMILELDSTHCVYQLLDESEAIYDVKELILFNFSVYRVSD